jgi:hypothetical protein
MSWFDIEVAGTLKAGDKQNASLWLHDAFVDLCGMVEDANLSVLYPDINNTRGEAAEELITVTFLKGCIESMHGDFTHAMKSFHTVLDNVHSTTTKSATRNDAWHEPFAMYEMACIGIRAGHFTVALQLLSEAAKKKEYLYRARLMTKIGIAQRYIADHLQLQTNNWNIDDVLGSWTAEDKNEVNADSSRIRHANVNHDTSFEISRPILKNQTMSWSWGVEDSTIWFGIQFKPNNSSDSPREVEPPREVKAGEMNDGYYTSTENGTLHFKWDNTRSQHLNNTIFYSIFE